MSLLFFMPDSIGRNTKKDYIRIEHEAGGAAGNRRINAPCIDATIFLTDARANCPHAEGGREAVIRLHRELRTVGSDGEAAEGFVLFGTAVGK